MVAAERFSCAAAGTARMAIAARAENKMRVGSFTTFIVLIVAFLAPQVNRRFPLRFHPLRRRRPLSPCGPRFGFKELIQRVDGLFALALQVVREDIPLSSQGLIARFIKVRG